MSRISNGFERNATTLSARVALVSNIPLYGLLWGAVLGVMATWLVTGLAATVPLGPATRGWAAGASGVWRQERRVGSAVYTWRTTKAVFEQSNNAAIVAMAARHSFSEGVPLALGDLVPGLDTTVMVWTFGWPCTALGGVAHSPSGAFTQCGVVSVVHWSGAIVNTAVGGAGGFLVVASYSLGRTFKRLRSGRCARCGYGLGPRRGGNCSECGSAGCQRGSI